MPTFSINQLREVAFRILQGAGVRDEDAQAVAQELADANAVGHDSHGIIRLKQYVNAIAAGDIVPDADVQTLVDRPSVIRDLVCL